MGPPDDAPPRTACATLGRVRTRALLIAVVVLACSVVAGTTTTAFAAPAGCVANASGLVFRCDQSDPAVRLRGAIGLIGDSVLLGSAPGMSNPSLPSLLAQQQWGPVRMTTGLGMRTRNNATTVVSAYHVLGNWKAGGFNPRVVAVNIGANHLADCTPSTVATCRAEIQDVVDRVGALWPDATIWWAKVVQRAYPSGAYTAGMLGWNAALDQVAKTRPGTMVVWDWPTALNSSGIVTDIGGIHPVSGAEYVKRSTLLAAHLTATMRATYLGPRVATPGAAGPALAYVPDRASTVLFNGTAAAGTVIPVPLPASKVAGAGAAAVTITSSQPSGGGYVTLFPCGAAVPKVSSLNFAPGQARSAQVIVRLGTGSRICARASVTTAVRISLQGTFVTPAAGTDSLRLLPPKRLVNTAATNTTTTHVITLTEATLPGADLDAAALTVTVDRPSASGRVTVYPCDAAQPPPVANVSFVKGETVAGTVFAPVSAADDRICVRTSIAAGSTFRLVVDRTGVFTKDGAGARFVPVNSTRLLDTRRVYRTGGWFGRHQALQTINVNAAPAGAVGVSGTLTMVGPTTTGYLTATNCGALPPTASVNGRPGTAAANTATTAVDAKGLLCVYASTSTDTVFDVAGWWQAPA